MSTDTSIGGSHELGQSAHKYGQFVLVLQGGGALGAYQAGVYQALHEAGLEPDWIIGTSIGAINASLIAGNEAENRLARLQEFWGRMTDKSLWNTNMLWPKVSRSMSYFKALSSGVPGFFEPNPKAFFGSEIPLGAESAGYYSTAPLQKTLADLVDFSLINRSKPRLSVGAAHLRSGGMRYFDSREAEICDRHIMAASALPPAFPAVRVDGDLYWDGGILSSTPAEMVFDDVPRRDSLIFAVHMWDTQGAEPESISEVLHRHKEIQQANRIASYVTRQRDMHRLRHVINKLAAYLPEDIISDGTVQNLLGHGCQTRMHIVRLLAPRLAQDDQITDIDFSALGIRTRWEAGYTKTMRAIEQAPWEETFDPLDGVLLHEP